MFLLRYLLLLMNIIMVLRILSLPLYPHIKQKTIKKECNSL